MKLPEFVEAAVLRPGDVLVVRLDSACNPAELDEFHARIKERLPENQVLVLAGGVHQIAVAPATST